MGCKICGSGKIAGRGLCRRHYQAAWKRGDFEGLKTKSEAVSVKERLLSKIEKSPAGCWIWTGHTRSEKQFPYGLVWVSGKPQRAHRVSYEIHKGKIPNGLSVLHKCDTPKCVNPDHLFLGTNGENCSDCGHKNRFPLNAAHWNAKLTVEQVAAIRSSGEANPALADRFGVATSTISRIRSGKRRRKV